MAVVLAVTSPALAEMPGPTAPGNAPQYSVRNPYQKPDKAQSPAWILKKNNHQITRPGFHAIANAYPSFAELSTSVVSTTLEPSANLPGSGYTGNLDDTDHSYTDKNMVDLCGPGALTNALTYWIPNDVTTFYGIFTDLSVKNLKPPGVTLYTYWTAQSLYDNPPLTGSDQYAYRGYILYLGWVSNPGGLWNQYNTGVMDSQHYPSKGSKLQDMTSVLNWEASGESSNYVGYFYVTQWATGSYNMPANFLQDVEEDVYTSGVPVVAEVNASDLPEWTDSSTIINHAITIIGYNNTAGTYYYTDTCGAQTGCGANNQQRVHEIPQSTLWDAIQDVPYNQSTGDGGWIW